MGGIWLNIGCGKKHLSGFVNMDIEQPYDVKLDARNGLPYGDGTVDGVYSEHFFEHLTQAEGLGFLRECRRVLKPDGVLRAAMPDLDDLVRRYTSADWRGDGDMFNLGYDWVVNRCEMMNIGMREWGHKHLYNEEEFVRIARLAGLEPINRCEHGKSDVPEFVGLETRGSSKLIMEFSVPNRFEISSTLVSVLLPVSSAKWFRESLKSVLNQTYQNIEIVVCDDSASVEIEKITHELTNNDKKVRYIKNTTQLGVHGNYLKVYEHAHGGYIKYLAEGDCLEPHCIETMLSVLQKHNAITLVTSKSIQIDELGNKQIDSNKSNLFGEKDCEINGISCANAIIQFQENILGNASTSMFRRFDLAWVEPHPMSFGGGVSESHFDVAMWLNLLSRGNVFVIAKPLIFARKYKNEFEDFGVSGPSEGIRNAFYFHGRRLGLVPFRIVWCILKKEAESNGWKCCQVITSRYFVKQIINHIKRAVSKF